MSLYRIGRAFFRLWFRLFYKHRTCLTNVIYEGGALLASNHASFFDPPMVGVSWPEDIHFLARDTLFKPPVFGWLISKTNAHPISRGGGDLHSIKLITRLLKEGKKVLIFPEGKRTEDGQMLPLKAGVAMIALKAQVPIIPIYLHGTYDVWNRHHTLPHLKGRTACVFGSPIRVEEFAVMERREAQDKLTRRLEEELHELKRWYETEKREEFQT